MEWELFTIVVVTRGGYVWGDYLLTFGVMGLGDRIGGRYVKKKRGNISKIRLR